MFCACIIECRKRLASAEIGGKGIERTKVFGTFLIPCKNFSLEILGCIVVHAKRGFTMAVTVVDRLCKEKHGFAYPVLLRQLTVVLPSVSQLSLESVERKTHLYLVCESKLNVLDEEGPE